MIECEHCHKMFDPNKDEIWFGSDPYAAEINEDYTKIWECRQCRSDSRDAI